jgi:WD40 repeat protein
LVRSLHAKNAVTDIAFSPDGSRLAAVGESKRLDLWDVDSGRPVYAEPPYFGGAGYSVEWLPDGRTLVYGGDDGRAVWFDVDLGVVRGVPLPAFRDGGAGWVFVAPTRGDRLALLPGARSGYALREGVIYSLNPADWLAHACDVVGRDLTKTEWHAYLPDRPYRRTCSELS